MTYYHATYADRLDSIKKHGLNPLEHGKNFPDCEKGIYLCSCPKIAIGFLIDHFLETADYNSSPKEVHASFRVIVIDDSRVDTSLLKQDPQISHSEIGFWLYSQNIDITGLAIVDANTVFHEQE